MKGLLAFLGFALTVPAANWMIGHVGACSAAGPCVIPVGFGLHAPSGVLMIGLALVLRDIVHEEFNVVGALAAITVGAVLSVLFAPPALVFASMLAFVLAELADLFVYMPLRARRLWLAVLASGLAGSIVDSAVFLYIAFGSFDFIIGQVVGKMWMSIAALPFVFAMRRKELAR
ncbi:MAG TPA: VUT family protein [Phyllobacterium sp.]|nr:VUT family protein [Phyllobacterium sp.]